MLLYDLFGMSKGVVYACELCDRHFSSRQSKWMHKQRSHPCGIVDNSDIDKRMVVIEKRILDLQSELDTLRAKHAFNTSNSFGPSTTVVNITASEQRMTIINGGGACVGSCSSARRISVGDMHPFGEDTEEFVSVSAFKECGYSLVKLMQLSHFNSVHPEHMNFIMVPDCCEKAYVLNRERRWVKVDFHTTMISLLWRIVQRVKTVNPAEALKYDDDTSFLVGGTESISFKAIQGVAMYSRTCVKVLTEMGVCLPGDLV